MIDGEGPRYQHVGNRIRVGWYRCVVVILLVLVQLLMHLTARLLALPRNDAMEKVVMGPMQKI